MITTGETRLLHQPDDDILEDVDQANDMKRIPSIPVKTLGVLVTGMIFKDQNPI